MTSKESSTVRRGAVGKGLYNRVQHLAGRLPYGDPMRDPEIMFEVCPDGKGSLAFHPVAIQQDYIGSYREAVWHDEKGRVMIHSARVRDIAVFARVWDRNLKHQGFVDAAKNRESR